MNTASAEVTAIARALIAANRDRVVWASDWPHVGTHAHNVEGEAPHVDYRRLDTGSSCRLSRIGRMATTLRAFLAHNSAKLYDFAWTADRPCGEVLYLRPILPAISAKHCGKTD